MKRLLVVLVLGLFILACGTRNKTIINDNETAEEVRIANDSLEYEIIIIDIGFDTYLHTIAKPMEFYSQSYYETKNRLYVPEWNYRYRNPSRYNANLYENEIDYDPNIDYGLEVNYKLYNYFKFVEYKYGERFF